MLCHNSRTISISSVITTRPPSPHLGRPSHDEVSLSWLRVHGSRAAAADTHTHRLRHRGKRVCVSVLYGLEVHTHAFGLRLRVRECACMRVCECVSVCQLFHAFPSGGGRRGEVLLGNHHCDTHFFFLISPPCSSSPYRPSSQKFPAQFCHRFAAERVDVNRSSGSV